MKVGDVVRYGEGSTALMQIEYVSPDHGGYGDRYYGLQCMGGACGAYASQCVPASEADLGTWKERGARWGRRAFKPGGLELVRAAEGGVGDRRVAPRRTVMERKTTGDKRMNRTMQDLRNMASAASVADRSDMDDLVFLHAASKMLTTSYMTFGLEQPEFLKQAEDVLTKEIRARRRDYLTAQLSQAKSRQESLKTTEQKRQDTAAEIERLQKQLEQG